VKLVLPLLSRVPEEWPSSVPVKYPSPLRSTSTSTGVPLGSALLSVAVIATAGSVMLVIAGAPIVTTGSAVSTTSVWVPLVPSLPAGSVTRARKL
jgi:hypothetical protein